MERETERFQAALPKRYRILRQLDGAGMSRVYLAREELPERDVAIKALDEDLSARLGRARFVREVELTSKLGHPHIVPIYAAGDADGILYYVMPYIDGESLRDRLKREEQLPISDALRITQQVADALQHAHDRGVVHRDVKPSNILLQSGFAVVADFGIARALSAAEGHDGSTTKNIPLGTPDYMSPEQASGDRPVDGRTDEYALACVLFEMLAGQPPFHSRTPQATLARHLTEPVPSIRVLRPTVPEQVEACIRRALSKAPADRYGSVGDFARALDLAPRAAESTWIAERGRKGPLSVAARVAGTLLIVAALGLAWQAWTGPPPPAVAEAVYQDSVAVMPFQNRTGEPAFDALGQSIADEIISDLATVQGLKVISTYTVQSLWGENLGIPRLLDTLDVAHLIDGFYEFRGDVLAVVVSELDSGGAVRSRRQHEIDLSAMDTMHLSVAHDIAQAFANHVGLEATGSERLASRSGPARDAYLAGNSWVGQRTPEGLRRAIVSFREAIEYDPTYAEAHAALSSAYALALYYKYDVGLSGYGLASMALASADSAVALDPVLSSAYSSRGYVRVMLGIDIDDAERDFARSLELAPNRPDGPSWSARILALRGRSEEALAEAIRARDLDPLQAGRHMAVATLALQLGDHALTLAEAREAHRLEPGLRMAEAVEARSLALLGRPAECLKLNLDVYAAVRAMCLHALGREGEAQELVAELERRSEAAEVVNPGFLNELVFEDVAVYHAFIGDADGAASWMRRAFDLSPNGVDMRLLGSALFDPVRQAPVFASTLTEVRSLAQERLRREPVGGYRSPEI